MRPVRLEMEGFASFRSPTTVDFTDADYFALVGPTGSGKSTVIDAMVFALYGTAPRWGRSNAIEYALAPTATRGTVRLVFDVGPHRYQVAREVRRVGRQGTVQQKGAFLERFLNASATKADSDQVQTVAAELREVKAAIESLMGLKYEDFTQAVVLPQGRFAEFLTATPGDRRDILLKLLGADQYERIRAAAAERQREAGRQSDIVAGQLEELADATPEAEAALSARVAELEVLTTQAEQQLAGLQTLREHERTAANEHARLGEAVALLSRVRAPEDVAELGDRAELLWQALEAARSAEAAAADAVEAARQEVEQAGPRGAWESLRAQHREAADLAKRLPTLREAAATARSSDEQARQGRTKALTALRIGQKEAEDAVRAKGSTTERLAEARTRRETLAAVRAPFNINDLAGQMAVAAAAQREADAAVREAEAADEAARTAARDAGDGAAERRTLEALARRDGLLQEIATLGGTSEAAKEEVRRATASVEEARTTLAQAEEAASHAYAVGLAADLRAHLTVGDDCPVCAQRVEALPDPLTGVDDSSEQRAVATAKDALLAAQRAERGADREATTAASRLATRHESLDAVESGLRTGHPGASYDELAPAVTARLRMVEEASAQQERAASALRAARASRDAAARQVEGLRTAADDARQEFREARAGLIRWGAPTQEHVDLAEAWAKLTAWSAGQVAELDATTLPQLAADADAAVRALASTGETARAAQERLDEADDTATAATRAEAEASGALERAEQRSATLQEVLKDQPDPHAVAAHLERLTAAEAADSSAREAHKAQRRAVQEASAAHRSAQDLLDESRRQLRAARDTVVPLGAPSLDEANPGAGWAALVRWAGEELTSVNADLGRARSQLDDAGERVAVAEADLLATVSEHGVEVADVSRVAPSIAGDLADARTARTSVTERIRRRTTLSGRLAKVTEDAKVAGLLAYSLRSDKFQKWLAGAALDLLVAAASDTLDELSGGQFGLSHQDGEFYVIDHEDAEATRSVRTLSGGETFQTSLALTLALADQLSSLSSTGARLESLFLDEGFGTLDADSLETVASTLERLAQGERMVGVVTHVPALAERVPTRFTVTRDSISSRVIREGPA